MTEQMTNMSIEQFAQQAKVRQLVVRFCDLVLQNEDMFRTKPETISDYFCNKYDTCRTEIDRICENMQQLINKHGVVGIRVFRDETREVLSKPVFLDQTIGRN